MHTPLSGIFLVIDGDNSSVCLLNKESQVVHAVVLRIQVAQGELDQNIFRVLLQNLYTKPLVEMLADDEIRDSETQEGPMLTS